VHLPKPFGSRANTFSANRLYGLRLKARQEVFDLID
jgi:hypothetical protein